MTTLITYASEHGSTREIAGRIRDVINAKIVPWHTELLPVDQISDLSKYSFIVIGSAVHGMQWLPIATFFLRNNSAALSKVPVWAFSVGSPESMPTFMRKRGVEQSEEKQLADAVSRDVKTKDHVLFSGRCYKNDVPLFMGSCWTCLGAKWGDFRDWDKIEAWASDIGNAIATSLRD